MTVRTDPEGYETDALLNLVELEGREVLEIGCGDGRLTWRYRDRAPTSRRSIRSRTRSSVRTNGSARRTSRSTFGTWPSRYLAAPDRQSAHEILGERLASADAAAATPPPPRLRERSVFGTLHVPRH
jgi:hypothetical protein